MQTWVQYQSHDICTMGMIPTSQGNKRMNYYLVPHAACMRKKDNYTRESKHCSFYPTFPVFHRAWTGEKEGGFRVKEEREFWGRGIFGRGIYSFLYSKHCRIRLTGCFNGLNIMFEIICLLEASDWFSPSSFQKRDAEFEAISYVEFSDKMLKTEVKSWPC